MKLIWKQVLWAAVMGMAVPSICLGIVVGFSSREQVRTAGEETTRHETAATTVDTVSTIALPVSDIQVSVLLTDARCQQMDLEEYLTGVVLAEMPADFEPEALKAQAVVARTYTLRRMETGTKHTDGDVCGNSNCCQGYKSPEDYLSGGGTQASVDKIRQAVHATSGQVLTYEGKLIEATYFSCSGGTTEDALAVWGTDIPYLQSTDSPGEENASHYKDSVFFSKEEFESCLGGGLSGSPTTWLGAVTYTTGGGVNTIQIGGQTYKGTQIRTLLGLRSTDFTMTASETGIEVVTHGYGHRVGMSQYGADAMAASGSDYTQILAHYYTGTTLETYTDDTN